MRDRLRVPPSKPSTWLCRTGEGIEVINPRFDRTVGEHAGTLVYFQRDGIKPCSPGRNQRFSKVEQCLSRAKICVRRRGDEAKKIGDMSGKGVEEHLNALRVGRGRTRV